jgi:hypothetical protein
MTSRDVAQRVASAYAHYGDSCWALHQSGRDAECESYDQLCARLLAELRAVVGITWRLSSTFSRRPKKRKRDEPSSAEQGVAADRGRLTRKQGLSSSRRPRRLNFGRWPA